MEITLNSKIYPLEAILNTCYTFIDRAYIFLDANHRGNRIKISLKGKNGIPRRQLKGLRGEFMNELLHSALRCAINKNNKKIREYIVGRALYSALPGPDLVMSEKTRDYQEDPLGIAIPWEEKYGRKKKDARIKV